MQFRTHTSAVFGQPLDEKEKAWFSPDVVPEVIQHLTHVPYSSTPLFSLPALARSVNIGAVLAKDEGRRSKLGSFKALGGSHAVIRLVLAAAGKALGRRVSPDELLSTDVQAVAGTLTFACATDGNHGRAVAAGARIAGANSRVFVHEGVSEARAHAIEAEGAVVTRTPGNYDDSLAAINQAAAESGWTVVSDTSWPGYESIPASVMQGYLVMASEAVDQALQLGARPTHVFLQAGVGGYAAAVAAYLSLRLGELAPRIIVVEPARAACLFESAAAGQAIRIPAREPTIMSMLECYEPSAVAWRILERLGSAFMVIDEDDALQAMQTLGRPAEGDPAVVAGESGGAGLAGALAAARDAEARQAMGLGVDSVVLVFNTEGATDVALYQQLMAQERV